VFIDSATRRNLEILATRIDGERNCSLVQQLDHCVTAMGSRLMKEWLLAPLSQPQEIESRLDAVQELVEAPETLAALRSLFAEVRDLERLLSRITAGRATPNDLGVLRDSLLVLP